MVENGPRSEPRSACKNNVIPSLDTGMGHMSNTSKQRMKIILRPVINKEPLRVTQSNKPIRVS